MKEFYRQQVMFNCLFRVKHGRLTGHLKPLLNNRQARIGIQF